MSPVDAYLADLRAALGDRLPPDLKEARLREARGHLLASAEEVGEASTVRRYGRPRAVANDLVRAHRGYDGRSVWRLALPIAGPFLLVWKGLSFVNLYASDDHPVLAATWAWAWALVIACLLAFLVRVVQTRRWLAGPMVAAFALGIAITVAQRHAYPVSYVSVTKNGVTETYRRSLEQTARAYAQVPGWNTPRYYLREANGAVPVLAAVAIFWLVVNAAALGLAELADRRRVRRA